MKWDKDKKTCVCSNNISVIFNNDDVITCKICGSSLNSLSRRINGLTCSCPTGLSWVNNVGCVCEDTQALVTEGITRCVTCDETIYSSKVAPDGMSCVCLSEALTWSNRTGKCSCPKASMIPLALMIPPALEETLTCFDCNNTLALTALPIVNGICSCKSTALVWNASGICACPDPAIEVYVSTTGKCLNCTSILSTGIDKVNPGNC